MQDIGGGDGGWRFGASCASGGDVGGVSSLYGIRGNGMSNEFSDGLDCNELLLDIVGLESVVFIFRLVSDAIQ